MTRVLRLFCLSMLCLAVPAVAHAQWDTPNRSFHKATAFPLDGRHLTVPCASCHVNGVTKGTPRACESCHWERRQDDIYRLRLGSNCAQCHTATAWTSVKWDHAAATGTPLGAAHKILACGNCHKNAQFTDARVACLDCHRKDFEATRNPNHRAAGFSTACESCHKPSDTLFTQSRFNHAAVFQLVGLHATTACAACHVGEKYKGTARDCFGCHRREYDQTKNPSHAAAGYATTCDSCHKATDATWTQAAVNHNQFFPLVGVHTTAACTSCHVNSVYKGTARDCYTCHRTGYDQTKNPNHAAAGYSTACDSCHKATDATWLQATFNHNQFFPLVGLHATSACTACHVNSVYKGTARDCYTCHRTSYDQTKNPNHAAAGYSTTCDSCHKATDATWLLATFNHNQFFSLVGVHTTTACTACHKNNVYKGTARDCYTCHRTSYDQTKNPNHAAAGYSTTCDSCHKATDATWLLAVFNHTQFYPLVGLHSTSACSACHVNNVYKGTSRVCYACHKTSYDQTKNPNHVAAGFSTTCDSCHKNSDSSWLLATFTHTGFPISSGRHAGIACATCHTNTTSYAVFSCMNGCHDKTTTDNKHKGRSGYQYVATACYSCHPQGRAG